MSLIRPEWKERAAIGRLVDGLPEPERTVVKLYYHAGRSSGSVAETLGTTEAVVNLVRERALHSLLEALGL